MTGFSDSDIRELLNNQKRTIRELKRIADALEGIEKNGRSPMISLTNSFAKTDETETSDDTEEQ